MNSISFWVKRATAFHAQGDWAAYRNVVNVIRSMLEA